LYEISVLTASTIGCEKVDLLIFDEISHSLSPLCQCVNKKSEMFRTLSMGGDDVPTNAFLSNLLSPHKIEVESDSMWSELLGEKRLPYVLVNSTEGKKEAKRRLGAYYNKVEEWLPECCTGIKNFIAVPVRCTRGVSHCVAIMLCVNKMVDVQGSPLQMGKKRNEFDKIDDVIFANQLCQFAGIAIANLELMYVGEREKRASCSNTRRGARGPSNTP